MSQRQVAVEVVRIIWRHSNHQERATILYNQMVTSKWLDIDILEAEPDSLRLKVGEMSVHLTFDNRAIFYTITEGDMAYGHTNVDVVSGTIIDKEVLAALRRLVNFAVQCREAEILAG